MNCSLRSLPSRKTVGESLGKVYTLPFFYFPRTLALGCGRMIFGKAARLHFQCRCSSSILQLSPSPPLLSPEASAAHRHRTHWRHFFAAFAMLIFFSIFPYNTLFQPCIVHSWMQPPCRWTTSRHQQLLSTLQHYYPLTMRNHLRYRARVIGI